MLVTHSTTESGLSVSATTVSGFAAVFSSAIEAIWLVICVRLFNRASVCCSQLLGGGVVNGTDGVGANLDCIAAGAVEERAGGKDSDEEADADGAEDGDEEEEGGKREGARAESGGGGEEDAVEEGGARGGKEIEGRSLGEEEAAGADWFMMWAAMAISCLI